MSMPMPREPLPRRRPAHRCPACRSTDIERAPRRGLEHLLPRKRPYQCCACGYRFLDRPTGRAA
jgi:predicted Zn-ribbon and HTH transcriptional regulator